MSYLGIDLGTSGCKAVVFADDGKPLSQAHRGYAVLHPQPDWAELDSRTVIDACCAVIAEAAKAASDPVRAIGISSQGEAFTPVGADGEYRGRAMVSSDSRAAGLVAEFTARFGLERLYRITGHTPSAMFTLFKLLWLKQHDPETWRQSARLLCFEDLLMLRLGVEPALGWPLAGRTMLFDVTRHEWSRDILAALELDETRLGRPLPSGTTAGILPRAVAAELGLGREVKLVAGGHDQTIAALGAGIGEPGTAMYAAGSVECLCPVVPKLTLSDDLCRHNLCCYDYSLPGCYTSVAYSLTGSNLLQYFKEQFGRECSYDTLLEEMPETPTELLALPYFTPSGTPYFDPVTPGALLGWRLTTSRGELLKGLLEAVALEMKLNLQLLEASGMTIERLAATGGGARNRRLVQLKADILDRPLFRLEIDEAGCYGAALLARYADCGRSPLDTDTPAFRPEAAVYPRPDQADRYREKFARYQTFYPGIRDLHGRLANR